MFIWRFFIPLLAIGKLFAFDSTSPEWSHLGSLDKVDAPSSLLEPPRSPSSPDDKSHELVENDEEGHSVMADGTHEESTPDMDTSMLSYHIVMRYLRGLVQLGTMPADHWEAVFKVKPDYLLWLFNMEPNHSKKLFDLDPSELARLFTTYPGHVDVLLESHPQLVEGFLDIRPTHLEQLLNRQPNLVMRLFEAQPRLLKKLLEMQPTDLEQIFKVHPNLLDELKGVHARHLDETLQNDNH